jgi:hypothetical protein
MRYINKSLLALPVAFSFAVLAWQAAAQDSAARDAAIGRCIRQAHLQYPNDAETDSRAAVYKTCMIAAGFRP